MDNLSPGWPQHYPQYQDCTYRITVTAGNLIQMYFNEFDLEHDPERGNVFNVFWDIRWLGFDIYAGQGHLSKI